MRHDGFIMIGIWKYSLGFCIAKLNGPLLSAAQFALLFMNQIIIEHLFPFYRMKDTSPHLELMLIWSYNLDCVLIIISMMMSLRLHGVNLMFVSYQLGLMLSSRGGM